MAQNSAAVPPDGVSAPDAAPSSIGPAILFSGQGSQEPGMGKDVAEADSDAMALWKEAESASGLPLREIFWDGEEKDMSATAALQPALTVVNFNLWRAAQARRDFAPAAFAGHSLGEYAALAAAKTLSPSDAVKITALRGRLMAECDPSGVGGMAAILKLSQDQALEVIRAAGEESGKLLVAANFNAPEQIVASGAGEALDLACAKAKALKGRAMRLKVDGAFHSPMMEEANKALAPMLRKAQWKDPIAPVYRNSDARPVRTGAEALAGMLRQMISPVFWVSLAREIYLAGVRWWVEISPRAVLGKMIGPSLAGMAGYCNDLRVDLINSLASAAQHAF